MLQLEPSDESRVFWEQGRMSPQFGAPGTGFDLEELRACMFMRQESAREGIDYIRTDIEGVPGQWVVAPGADQDVRLLYLHGGGFVSGSGDHYLHLAAEISLSAQCAVLLADYRLAPEHPFPAALDDCVQAYQWMRENSPRGVKSASASFIAGDSAGGGLALSSLLALKERGIPLPIGGIAFSAFADLTLASESIQGESETELYMHPDCLPEFVKRYASSDQLRDPLVSPVFGDYHDIPPLLVQVGEYEVIRDDSVRVAAKAEADGVRVQLEVWPGQVHVFQVRGLPESRLAIEHVAEFMTSCLPES